MSRPESDVAGGGVDTPRSRQDSQRWRTGCSRRGRSPGVLTLKQALERAAFSTRLQSGVIEDLALQLDGKWKYQCTVYAKQHPEEDLPQKTQVHNGRTRIVSRTCLQLTLSS